MSKTPATPKSPPAPVVPAGGSIFATAGGGQTGADAVGALSGPWFVKTQTLAGSYTRVPIRGAQNFDASSFSLSAQSTSHFVGSTRLVWNVVASFDTYKDFNNYATSSYFQPQKFTLYPSQTDIQSNIYDAPVGYQLGPRGEVLTTQAAIFREEWDDNNSSHGVSAMSMNGWTFANAVYDEGGWKWDGWFADQPTSLGGLGGFGNFWSMPEEVFSYMPSQGLYSRSAREWFTGQWDNVIAGPYQLNTEVSTIVNLQAPIDSLGYALRVAGGVHPVMTSHVVKGFFKSATQMGTSRNGFSSLPNEWSSEYYDFHPFVLDEYDWTLHDWS